MALSWNEIKDRALKFSKEWADTSNEEADAKPFLVEFFNVFGISSKRVSTFEKKIPTPKERIEKSYLSYLHTYDFTDEQILILKKIKEVFASNVASKRNIDEKEIFGNPIYERLIGSYEEINKKFDGKFHLVINDLKQTFGNRLNH